MDKSTLKRETGGERRRGGGLEKQRVHEQITKAALKPNTSEGVFIPVGPVRPVRWTGQTGARDRSDRLACSTLCTRSHPTAEVLSSKRSLLRDAAVLMKI